MRLFVVTSWATALLVVLLCFAVPQHGAIILPRFAILPQGNGGIVDVIHQNIMNHIQGPQNVLNSVLRTSSQYPINSNWWEKALGMRDTVIKYSNYLLDKVSTDWGVSNDINNLKRSLNAIQNAAKDVQAEVAPLLRVCGKNLENLSEDLGVMYAVILDDAKKEFPPPKEAAGHQQRQEMLDFIMRRAEDDFLKLVQRYGASDQALSTMKKSFETIHQHILTVVVTTSDIIEQHPVLLETILFSIAGMLIPEWLILRPLLSLFGLGPGGPIKGSAAAWVQSRLYGAYIPAGSWFSFLQRAAAIGSWKVVKGIGAGIGVAIGLGGFCR